MRQANVTELRMMHKTFLIFRWDRGCRARTSGDAAHAMYLGSSAKAASAGIVHQLNLFGEVFERCAPTSSRSPTTASSSNRRLTACWPGSIRIELHGPKGLRDMQVQTRGDSAVSAWRSPWRMRASR